MAQLPITSIYQTLIKDFVLRTKSFLKLTKKVNSGIITEKSE